MSTIAKILIVDDNYLMRRTIERIVREMGHEVVGELDNGKHLPFKFRELIPDLITLDIVMAEKTGLEALKELKDQYPFAKVIMVTSIGQKRKVLQALKFGADHFVVKPINEEKLKSVINQVLGPVKAVIKVEVKNNNQDLTEENKSPG
ncbi:MAG TPA: response regulator [Thermotogota bacterium]|nr:response regulator [Thermotogota bacterium]HRW34402.1 response regulator [Thermotogota bacterium]